MTHQYKVGDRVKLVTNGGYSSRIQAGMEGTVRCIHTSNVVEVTVDGASSLNFYLSEITPLMAEKVNKEFFLIRQKKDDPSKVKVCWAETTLTRTFTDRAKAEACAVRQNANYPKWNYFVVEKETV